MRHAKDLLLLGALVLSGLVGLAIGQVAATGAIFVDNATVNGNTFTTAASFSPWWGDAAYQSRLKLTFDNSGQSENLTNFPVLVELDSTRIDYAKTQDQGQDIRFIDDDSVTELKYEIEEWDETGISVVWVKVPQIDAGSTTDHIWMYYNNPSATDNQDPAGVWSNGYAGVWHLHDDFEDSTSNNNDGNNYGSTTIAGQIADGQNFNGSGNYIQTTSNELKTAAGITLSAWLKADVTTGAHHIVWQGRGTENGWGAGAYGHHEMHINVGTYDQDNVLGCFYGTNEEGSAPDVIRIDTAFSDTANFHQVVFTVTSPGSGPVGELFLDGVSKGADTGNQTGRGNWNTNFRIGRPGANQRYFNGQIDEVRISTLARSADWIAAEYKSMDGTFVTFGDEETAP